MAELSGYSVPQILALGETIELRLKQARTLQAAAQEYVELLYREFAESVVLVRLFATQPLKNLPARDRTYVMNLASASGMTTALTENTLVLSLLGTYGTQSMWTDRYLSQGHLGIPLTSASFVQTIPMVTRVLESMDIGLGWIDSADTDIVVKKLGRMVGVFYVKDATLEVDRQQRKIVAAQDFVAANAVKTVFGFGGGYLDGTFVVLLFFTRVQVPQSQVENLMPLLSSFKSATSVFVMQGALYS